MRKVLLTLVGILMFTGVVAAQTPAPKKAPRRHSTLKTLSFPVRHPVKSASAMGKFSSALANGGFTGVKGVAYGVLFIAEPVADVGNMGFSALDYAVNVEFAKKIDPIHYVAVGFGYADKGIERGQDLLFGSHQ